MSSTANDGSAPMGGPSGIQNISSLRARIEAAQVELVKLFQDTEDAAKLIGLIQSSTGAILGRFNPDDDEEQIPPSIGSDIERVATALEDIYRSTVQDHKILGVKRRKRKWTVEDFQGWQETLETALNILLTSDDPTETNGAGPSTSTRPNHHHQTQPAVHPADPHEGKAKKKSRRGEYALEASDAVFALAARAAECAPAPFGPAANGIFATAKEFVKALKDVKANREAVDRLQTLVTDYTKRITNFLDEVDDANDPVLQDAALVASLNTFQERFALVAAKALKIKADGKLKQALKHTLNRTDLDAFSVELEDAFKGLRFQLHLNATKSIRWLECQRLLDILGGADNGATSKAARPEDLLCQQGTREDVLDDINSWAADLSSGNVIWISGVAGSGKTALAATVAHQQASAGVCVATFHFNRSTQSRNGSVVRSLARMLALSKVKQLTAAILAGVRRLQESSSDFLSIQFDHVISTPLTSLPPDSGPIICVIDALDEWEDVKGALELLRLISTSKLPSFAKFIITGRRDRHLETEFTRIPPSGVRHYHLDAVPQDAVTKDIRLFLETELAKMRYSASIAVVQWPGPEVLDKLAHMAQGLFQWAVTICKYIEGGYLEDNLNAVLSLSSDPAQELDDVYRLVIHRFATTKGTNVPLLNEALGCLVVAPTPMGLATLAYILKRPSESLLVSQERLKGAVLSHLRALLVIPDDVDEPIRFLHSSIIDFLTDSARCTEAFAAVDLEDHHARVAQRCFHLMARDLTLHIPEKTECLEAAETWERAVELISTPLRYVTRYWPEYLLHLKPDSTRIVQYDLGALLGDFAKRSILAWIEAMACMGEVDTAASHAFLVEGWLGEVDRAGGLPQVSLQSRAANIITMSVCDVLYLFRETQQLIAASHGALSHFSFNANHTLRACLPVDTRLYSLYSRSLPDLLKVIRGPKTRNWSPCIWQAANISKYPAIALSKDGRHIVSGARNGVIRLWSTATRKEVGAPVNLEMGQVCGVAFGVGGTIVAATRGSVTIWKMETKEKEVLRGSGGSGWSCVATSSDGSKIVAGGSGLYLWEEGGMKPPRKLKGHSEEVITVAFSPDDSLIASGSSHKTVRLWDVSTATQRGKPLEGHFGRVTSVAFSPDGRTLVSGSKDDTIRLWIIETGECKWNIQAPSGWVNCVAVSRDGSTIASGSNDWTVRLWDAETGRSKGEPFRGHLDALTSMVFTLDDRSVISGSDDGTIRMWDVSSPNHPVAQPLEGWVGYVSGIAFSPHGEFIVTASSDRTLRRWDTETGKPVGNRVAKHSAPVRCVAFSRDGRCIVSGDYSGTIRIWDPSTFIPRDDPVLAHSDGVTCISFSPDSTTFVSFSQDGTICRWDADTCRKIGELVSDLPRSILSADFATSGRHFLSFRFSPGVFLPGQQTIYLHDAASGARLGNPNVPRGHQLTYRAIFSSDDTAVISDMGYAWDVQGILDGTRSDAVLVPGSDVVFETMRSDITIPLCIDAQGWINLAGKPFLWLPPDYGREKSCWWRRGIIVIADPRVLILDARDVPLG